MQQRLGNNVVGKLTIYQKFIEEKTMMLGLFMLLPFENEFDTI